MRNLPPPPLNPQDRLFFWLTQLAALVDANALAAGVSSFNTRTGAVVPAIGDYAGFYVPLTRTINGHALSADLLLTAADVGALTKALADGYYDSLGAAAAITLAGLGGVPTTRTINGYDLSADRTLTAADLSVGWKKVFDYTVSGGAVTSVSTGNILNGDTEQEYLILMRVIAAVLGPSIDIQPNADATAGNYGYQYAYANNTSMTAARSASYAGLLGTYTNVVGQPGSAVVHLFAKSGYVRQSFGAALRIETGPVPQLMLSHGRWTDTASNITSLTFKSNVANAIANDSNFVVFAKVS